MKRPLTAVVLVVVVFAAAAQPPGLQPYPDVPDAPPPSYQGERVEPEITIIETESDTIYEYRVRGRLYMVKVQPQIGPPYYLLDTNGDGEMDAKEDRVWNNSIPQWVLFSW